MQMTTRSQGDNFKMTKDGLDQWLAAMSAEKTRNISVGVGVIAVQDNRFLVTQRSQQCKTGAGFLALPGGYIEEGETAEKAAVREMVEETGLITEPILIDNHRYVITIKERFSEGHIISFYVGCEIIGGNLKNREPDKHANWRFVTVGQAKKIVQQGTPHWLPLKAIEFYREQLGL